MRFKKAVSDKINEAVQRSAEALSVPLMLDQQSLDSWPADIFNIEHLQWLGLSHNKLTILPPDIRKLHHLHKLDLSNNRIETLDSAIEDLVELQDLDLSDNQIKKLPEEIGQLERLRRLDLSNNRVKNLPLEIQKLQRLEFLNLKGNPIDIPPEILELSFEPRAILNYYFSSSYGQKRPLNEVKVIVVGQGAVGKTSLVNRLLYESYDPRQGKTEGINIKRWELRRDSKHISLNIWDFGGQEIMYATHQFFLTKRSLYLLVLDSRLSAEENRIEYWLRMIQSFGGASPVILVGNKVDQHSLDINRTGLLKKFPTVKAIVETSCDTGYGIQALKDAIFEEISSMPHVQDSLLLTWFAVKQKLEMMEKDHISYQDYVGICQQASVIDEISQRTLIGFLHDLGIVLNFQDDPRLEDTNILNPGWVTGGVYCILNSHVLFQNKGILKIGDLRDILDEKQYPNKRDHMFILDMMEKFELCFRFDSPKDTYLVPDLLPKDEPFTGDWSGATAFRYCYSVLPSSIICRFIVRMRPHISQNTVWRTGIVLKIEENQALVRADMEEGCIEILVEGKHSRETLGIIRSTLEAIHRTIPGLNVTERVPVLNYPQVDPIKYQDLIQFEREGRETYPINVGGEIKDLSVSELLNGVESELTRSEYKNAFRMYANNNDNQSGNMESKQAEGLPSSSALIKIILIFLLPFLILISTVLLIKPYLNNLELIAVVVLGLVAVYTIINSVLKYIGAIDNESYSRIMAGLPKMLTDILMLNKKK